MGFSLGGAISGALGGFLVGGPGGAIAGGAAGGFLGGGDPERAKVQFAQAGETEQASAARAELFATELPELPTRKIAPARELTEGQKTARTAATDILQEDFLSAPDVQALIQETIAQGNLLTNRVGRALQASGNITSTPGRDVLGRTVKQIEQSIVARLSPFAESARGRKLEAAKLLEGLEISDVERERIIQQAEFDADFAQKLQTVLQPFTLRKPLLESIIGLQPAQQPIITGGGASDPLGGFGDIIGPLLSNILKGGGNSGPSLADIGGIETLAQIFR